MKVAIVRGFLIATVLEGLAAVFLLFRIPSMDRNAWLFGFSLGRTLLGIAILVTLLTLAWMTVRYFRRRSYLEKHLQIIESRLLRGNLSLHTITVLLLMVGVGLFFTALFSSNLVFEGDVFKSVFQRSKSVVFWIMAVAGQLIILLLIIYPHVFRQRIRSERSIVGKEAVFVVFVLLTLLQWAILLFNIDWFQKLSGWYWRYSKREDVSLGLFLLILIVAICVVWLVQRNPLKWRQNLLLLFCFGYFLQIGFGYLEGRGFESIRLRYVIKGRPTYSEIVARDSFTIGSLTQYDELYGNIYRNLSTKPPGYLLFHGLTRLLVDPFHTNESEEDRFDNLTRSMAVLYPLISLLVLPALFLLGRRVLGSDQAIQPLVVYACFPGMILFTIQLDQVLFPLLFTIGIILGMQALARRSWIFSIFVGIFLYCVVFTSFSILPLLFFLGAYLVFATLLQARGSRPPWKAVVGIGFCWLAGAIIAHIVARVFFNIDLVTRFQRAMVAHQQSKDFVNIAPGIEPAFLVNNLEFAFWVGFPVVLFLFLQLAETVRSLRIKPVSKFDLLMLSFVVTLIPLNILGETRAEVARMWLFLLPMISLAAFNQTKRLPFERGRNVLLLVVFQLVTTFMIFLFQFPWQ